MRATSFKINGLMVSLVVIVFFKRNYIPSELNKLNLSNRSKGLHNVGKLNTFDGINILDYISNGLRRKEPIF